MKLFVPVNPLMFLLQMEREGFEMGFGGRRKGLEKVVLDSVKLGRRKVSILGTLNQGWLCEWKKTIISKTLCNSF